MSTKVDISRIFRVHFGTLKTSHTGKTSKCDIVLFYLIPTVFSGWLVAGEGRVLTASAINLLSTVFSIFVGLLLNLLVLIVGILPKPNDAQSGAKTLRNEALEETFSNVSYAILISVVAVILLLASKLLNGVALGICSFFVFLIAINFLLTLLMVLKRVHTVIYHDITK